MDADRLAAFIRSLNIAFPRRTALGKAVAASLGPSLTRLLARDVAAKKKRKKKKVKFNGFGCVDVGKFCKNGEQCCSGVCQGKRGKKKCKAHDAEGCQAGQVEEFCGGVNVLCTTSAGDVGGACDTTTGNAGYCTGDGECFECTKDADCTALCGPQAACIICGGECEETGGTACVGPGEDSCSNV